MDERGLWKLFFATGLPQAYLAIRGEALERDCPPRPQAKTAFAPGRGPARQI